MAMPKTTVAIPLHASMRFIDVVSANLDRLPRSDIEIIISDRTQRDEAFDVLQSRHSSDPRIVWISTSEDLGWVDHYNDLLRRARGEYMCWMPHDDDFPENYIEVLAGGLDADASALLAFGTLTRLDISVDPPRSSEAQGASLRLGELPRGLEAVRLAKDWNAVLAFRGLFRREPIVSRRMFLCDWAGQQGADVVWVQMVAAAGHVLFRPETGCVKRRYPESTHRSWPRRRLGEILMTVPSYAFQLVRARIPWRDALPLLRFSAGVTVHRLRKWGRGVTGSGNR